MTPTMLTSPSKVWRQREEVVCHLGLHSTFCVSAYMSHSGCAHTGVEKVFGLENLSDYEKEGLKIMLPDLMKNITTGQEFAAAELAKNK